MASASLVQEVYKMFNITRFITQPLCHIIKHTSQISLRIDNFLITNRLRLLSSIVGVAVLWSEQGGVWGVREITRSNNIYF